MNDIETLEGRIRELREYLLRLEQLHEMGEITDEVYQELKNTYSKELERYEAELEESKKKLEVEGATQVVATQSLPTSELQELSSTVYSTLGVRPGDESFLAERSQRLEYRDRGHQHSTAGNRGPEGWVRRKETSREITGTRVHHYFLETKVRTGDDFERIQSEVEGTQDPPLFLLAMIVTILFSSAFIAVVFDPIFSLIVAIILIMAAILGYHSGSKTYF
ncbi:MAG: hypothetical protein QW320_08095 [Ignisphaera sp.]